MFQLQNLHSSVSEPAELLLAFSKEFYFDICQVLALNSQGNASNQIMISTPFHNPKQTKTETGKTGGSTSFLNFYSTGKRCLPYSCPKYKCLLPIVH